MILSSLTAVTATNKQHRKTLNTFYFKSQTSFNFIIKIYSKFIFYKNDTNIFRITVNKFVINPSLIDTILIAFMPSV